MKIDRHHQAKILSADELAALFTIGLKSARDRALFGVCLYTGTRTAEACSLHTKDVYAIDGSVRPRVTIRKGTTKDKIETSLDSGQSTASGVAVRLLVIQGVFISRSPW